MQLIQPIAQHRDKKTWGYFRHGSEFFCGLMLYHCHDCKKINKKFDLNIIVLVYLCEKY